MIAATTLHSNPLSLISKSAEPRKQPENENRKSLPWKSIKILKTKLPGAQPIPVTIKFWENHLSCKTQTLRLLQEKKSENANSVKVLQTSHSLNFRSDEGKNQTKKQR
ncbi:hypothetical protein NPIL_378961 [Nephila pilipes]|uniref:Uncharacterized protein n=1 Tax=Nephila pilipes TaxID=299642 RepID=A0A8X6N311_NEPPI|nr:hypothetical protein NPIL_378961 [Nephila pilipes]